MDKGILWRQQETTFQMTDIKHIILLWSAPMSILCCGTSSCSGGLSTQWIEKPLAQPPLRRMAKVVKQVVFLMVAVAVLLGTNPVARYNQTKLAKSQLILLWMSLSLSFYLFNGLNYPCLPVLPRGITTMWGTPVTGCGSTLTGAEKTSPILSSVKTRAGVPSAETLPSLSRTRRSK